MPRKKDFEKAIACYQRIPAKHTRYGWSARYEESQLFAKTDQIQRAEDSFVEFLQSLDRGIQLSNHQVAHARRWLSLIYSVELRIKERRTIPGSCKRVRL